MFAAVKTVVIRAPRTRARSVSSFGGIRAILPRASGKGERANGGGLRRQLHDEQRVVRPPARAHRMIVAAAGHAVGEARRGERMIDAEPAARAAPARVAEPGMLPGITVLSA